MINDPMYQAYLNSLNLDPSSPPTLDLSNWNPFDPATTVNKAISGFNAWKAKQVASNQEHDQYVQLSQANAGRRATIFAAPGSDPVISAATASLSPTLLNENATNRKKTLIGGY